jgi:ssDNA-binding Zn-finger/Zn-ribbon topoisomerase 1
MVESFKEIHERLIVARAFWEVRCPKCKSEEIVIKTEKGYFWVCECRKCKYKRKDLLS